MGIELIDYKDRGFEISDFFMQLALYYINEELRKEPYIFTNKYSLEEYHKSVTKGHMVGWFAFLWDSYIVNPFEEQTMIDILQTVKTIIHSKGSYISITELQTIPTEDPDFKTFFEQPILTAELIKIFDALIQLLQGTWHYTKYDLDSDIKY